MAATVADVLGCPDFDTAKQRYARGKPESKPEQEEPPTADA
eukprot:gene22268-30796_t